MVHTSHADTIPHLSQLQQIDADLDQIQQQKGILPKLVAQLDQEIQQSQEQQKEVDAKKVAYNQQILEQREKIKETEQLIDKYSEELKNTKNDRQYKVISEDLEVQKIEIKLFRRRILETKQHIQTQNELLEEANSTLEKKQKTLSTHQEKLKNIQEKTDPTHQTLTEKRADLSHHLPEKLYAYYQKIRTLHPDAIVKVLENACSGCCIIVPVQQQIDIKAQQNLETCLNCGRILIEVIKPEVKEPKRRTRRLTRQRKTSLSA